MEASLPKWVNSTLNIIGINSIYDLSPSTEGVIDIYTSIFYISIQ